MKQFSKILAALLAVILTVGVLAGCGDTPIDGSTPAGSTPVEGTGPNGTTGGTTPNETTAPIRPFETTAGDQPTVPAPYVYEGFTDIPLLVIKINYQPAGGDPVLLKQKDDTYFYNMLFGDNDMSMKTYYHNLSNGNFCFTPATESYVNADKKNVANDGIVEVTVKQNHSGGTSSNETGEAVKEASNYVDFSVFDKNGDKTLTKDELAIAFITAGYEATRAGSATPSHNAYYKSASFSASGVGISGGFVMIGEMMNSSTPITVGSFCHELSHYLGAVDLYTNKNWGWANSPAGKVSVMAGNGSAGKNNGESTGRRPSYLDAYHLVALKFQPYTVIGDGEYTLYSRQSTEGEYGILKIETPNPKEYYLIENRFFDNNTPHFDSQTNWDGTRGVIIWHVDENYALASKGGSASTGGNNGADIGVAALAPRKEGGEIVHPANSGVFGVAGQVFKCEDYEFPLNGTWNTSENEVWGDFFKLRIEILTNAGHEMKIKVSGAKKADFPIDSANAAATASQVAFKGQIQSTHGKRLLGVTVELSDKWDYSNILSSVESSVSHSGVYGSVFSGLAPQKQYYLRAIYHFEDGDFIRTADALTKKESTSQNKFTALFFRGLSNNDKAFEQKVDAGAPVKVAFPMKKDGYVFGGWYRDPACTEYFEVSNPTEAAEMFLFAKWIPENEAAKLTVVGATLVNDKANPAGYGEVGGKFHVPVATQNVEWYADEALTTPFDFNRTIASADEVTIYAKVVG